MIATFLLAFLAASGPPNGVYFEQTTVLRQHGQTRSPGVRSRVWCKGRRLRLEAADQPGGPALILRLDEGRVLRLEPESRTATELDASRLRSRAAADAAVAAGMMGGPAEAPLRTTALAGERTVAGHVCRGYRIHGPSFVMDTWVARDVPASAESFADFVEWSGAGQALSDLLAAIRALPGFPLETRMRLDVLGEVTETLSTVTLIRAAAVPAERFEVPSGWRLASEPKQPAEPER